MAISLASMLAVGSALHASLPAAFLHELLNRGKALAFLVADFLAYMPALEWKAAGLSAIWWIL